MPTRLGKKTAVDIIRAEAAVLDTDRQAVIGTLPSGEIVSWNGTAERIYGWSFAEVEGRSILDVTPSALSREQAAIILQSLHEGRSWSGTFEVQAKSGAVFRMEVRDIPLMNRHGELIGLIGVSTRAPEPDAEGRELPDR